MNKFFPLALACALFAGLQIAAADDANINTLTDAEKADGWKLLFDGKNFDGWHNFKQDGIRPGWQVKDGELVCVDPHNAGDIVTDDKFDWFELQLDYNISVAGNSGIMFHVTNDGSAVWATGPEFQLEDNVTAADPDPLRLALCAVSSAGGSCDRQNPRRHQAGRRMEPRPPRHQPG